MQNFTIVSFWNVDCFIIMRIINVWTTEADNVSQMKQKIITKQSGVEGNLGKINQADTVQHHVNAAWDSHLGTDDLQNHQSLAVL